MNAIARLHSPIASACQKRYTCVVESGVWLSLARAPGLGPGSRRFESCHPDSFYVRKSRVSGHFPLKNQRFSAFVTFSHSTLNMAENSLILGSMQHKCNTKSRRKNAAGYFMITSALFHEKSRRPKTTARCPAYIIKFFLPILNILISSTRGSLLPRRGHTPQ